MKKDPFHETCSVEFDQKNQTIKPKVIKPNFKYRNNSNEECKFKSKSGANLIKMEPKKEPNLGNHGSKSKIIEAKTATSKNELFSKITSQKNIGISCAEKNSDLDYKKQKMEKKCSANSVKVKAKESNFKFLVYHYFLSFESKKSVLNFVLTHLEFEIFKCILKSSKSYNDEHFSQILCSYIQNKIIHSKFVNKSQENPPTSDSPIRHQNNFYSILSTNLEIIQKDFLNGTMPLHLSSRCVLKIFEQILICGQPNYESIYKSLKVDPRMRKVLVAQIQRTLKQSESYLASTHPLEIKKNLKMNLEFVEKGHESFKSIQHLVALDFLVKNPNFAQVFFVFLNMLRLPELIKKGSIYHLLGFNIRSQVDHLLKIISNLREIDQLGQEDVKANLVGFFECGFIGEILSFVQIQEAAEVTFERWFN